MLFKILRPLLVLCAVSSGMSFILCTDTQSFIKYFVGTSILQFVVYNTYINIISLFRRRVENQRIAELSKQGVEITCPCAKGMKHFIPIRLDEDNSYRCLDCPNYVRVDVDVKPYITSDVIDIVKTEEAIESLYDQAIKQSTKNVNTTTGR